MKAKISELIGGPLDWAVASLNGVKPLLKLADSIEADGCLPYSFDLFHDIKTYKEVEDILAGKPHCSGLGSAELRAFAQELGYVIDQPVCPPFSTDYACGGPILERLVAEGFEIRQATFSDSFQVFRVRGDRCTSAFGPTLLVAAMRCHLLHRLGVQADAEIDVPDEIMRGTPDRHPEHRARAPGSLLAHDAAVISSDDPLARHIVANLWRRYRFAKKMLARSESQSYSEWARLSLESNRRQAFEAAVAASNALYAIGQYAGLHEKIMVGSSARARVRGSIGQEHLDREIPRHSDNPLARSIVAILWKIHRARGRPLGESSESWNAAVTASQILYGTSDFEYVHRALAHDVPRVRLRPDGSPRGYAAAAVRPHDQPSAELRQAHDAICHLLSSAIDLSNGWPQRELHEPLSDTIQRGLAALPESLRGDFRVEHDPSWTDRARGESPAG